jgi:hypothetical protein
MQDYTRSLQIGAVSEPIIEWRQTLRLTSAVLKIYFQEKHEKIDA